MKINVKLLGGFLLVVLFILALSFYSLDTAQRSLKESIGRNTVFLAEEMLGKMDQSIFFNIETLQRSTKAFLLQKFISESNREFERLKSISEYIDKKDSAWVAAPKDEITPFMQELSDNELSDSLRRKFIEFYFKKRGARVFPEVLVTNKYGAIVALTGKTANYRQDDKKWWKAAKEKGFYVGDVEYAERVGTNVIPLGIRVDDQEGNLIGVMKALVKSEEIIRRSVITTKKFDTTQIKLLTKNGRLVYSTKAFRFLEKVSEKDFFKKIKTENSFFISIEGGKEWLFSYAHSRSYGNFEGLGWILVVGHEVDEVLKSSIELRNNLVVAFLILIAAVIIIAILISRSITKPITKLTRGVEIIGKGDLEHRVEIKTKDEIGSLGTAFNSMVGNLQKASLESERHNFINTGQSELDDHMRGDQPIDGLCKNIITFVANYLKVQVGTLYVNDGEGIYKLKAGYAYKSLKKLPSEFKTGEGLIGQAAFEKQSIFLTNVPDDYITVTSSLGKKKPKNILVIPFIYNETVMGILELGSFDEFSELKTTFLEGVSERVAIAINSSQARVQIQSTLEVTQRQAEDLESQQEELRAANEELEEQTQRLQASEEELKAQQEELQVTNEELEEKTESLERQKQDIEQKNRDLDQARRELEERAEELATASKYKSEFLANMSHELRTPLNSILLLSSLLTDNKEDNLSEEQLEFANVIHSSGNELLSLIDEILDFSKIEAGQMELRMKKVLIRDLADTVKANFQHMADDKGLNLKIAVSKTAPGDIFTDRKRVEQIIKNFMSNAIKFTEKGGVTVNFGRPPRDVNLSRSGLDIKKAIAIAVRDTGIGIPPEKQNVIFEAFQQVEGGTTRQYHGTGLGLSISRELAQLLGGEIQLSSEEGQGSTFTIYLPIAKDDVKREKKKAHDQPAIPPGRMPLRAGGPVSKSESPRIPDDRDSLKEEDKTILVIEDDPRFAKLLLKQCHQNGFKCLASATGEEGLKLAETHFPKAIILDIRLPGIDGWAVLESLKDKPETRHIPVHIISVEDATIDALKKGAIGFLEKPAKKEELEEVFGKLGDMLSREIKNLLVVEDNENQRKGIVKLVGNGDVHIDEAATGEETIRALKSKKYDCVILDLGLPDMTGFQLLKRLEAMEEVAIPPVIVYTGRELTREQEAELSEYAESVIIKGVGSEDRLLDESSLFLHRVVGKMPKKKRKIITDLHDSDVMFRDRHVLIVDDDMRNLFALSRALEEKGVKVLKAEDGQKALEVMKKEPGVDLILMDIMMPVMDGYETMKRIRAQEKFQKLPIIALTAKAMKQDRARCIEAGASDYLPKPVDVNRLFSMMRVWLYR